MTRFLLGFILTAAMVGCTGIQPVGPFAKMGNGKSVAKGSKAKEPDSPPEPVTVPAVKPTPPVNWVDPSDVALDPYAAREKLANELEADQRTIPTLSRTAEVSVIKGGMKQN